MRTEEVIVRAVLGVILGLLVWIVKVTADSFQAETITIIVLCSITVLLGIAFGSVLRVTGKNTARALVIISVLAGITFAIIHFHLIPVCGDGYCTAGECTSCQEDCSPQTCMNGVCEKPMERCDNSIDCTCASNQVCEPQGKRNVTHDERGCYARSCGDGYCDAPENQENCCNDCGCKSGYTCDSNLCYFEPPKVTMNVYPLTNTISATTLAVNPSLTNDSGVSRPFAWFVIRSSGYVNDMTAEFSVPGIFENRLDIPWTNTQGEQVVFWYATSDKRLLNVVNDTKTNLFITLRYHDALEDERTITRSYPITILGHDTLDEYGSPLFWITRDVTTNAKTADGIWDELRAGMTVLKDRNTMQFPQQTITRKAGTQRDIAILLASAYDAAGLHPYLVDTRDGFMVRLQLPSGNVMLNPSLVNATFGSAIYTGFGSRVYDIEKERIARNMTIIS